MLLPRLPRLGLLCACGALTGAAMAAGTRCDGEPHWSISALRQLPYQVQQQLVDSTRCGSRTPNSELVVLPALLLDETASGTGAGFGACISDPGGPFRAGDVGGAADLPTTRLVAAVASADCIDVTLEHGGYAHDADVLTFVKRQDDWLLLARHGTPAPAGH